MTIIPAPYDLAAEAYLMVAIIAGIIWGGSGWADTGPIGSVAKTIGSALAWPLVLPIGLVLVAYAEFQERKFERSGS